MSSKLTGELEVDEDRGVIYFTDGRNGTCRLRMQNLPKPIPRLNRINDLMLDINCVSVLTSWFPNYLAPKHIREDHVLKISPASNAEIAKVFHDLWTASVGTPEYDKKQWKELRSMLSQRGIQV